MMVLLLSVLLFKCGVHRKLKFRGRGPVKQEQWRAGRGAQAGHKQPPILIYTSILLTSDSLMTPEGLRVINTECFTTPSLTISHYSHPILKMVQLLMSCSRSHLLGSACWTFHRQYLPLTATSCFKRCWAKAVFTHFSSSTLIQRV